MNQFIGYNSFPTEDGKVYTDGTYINVNEIAAMEGFAIPDEGGKYTVVYLKSGAKLQVLGSPYALLQQAEDATSK